MCATHGVFAGNAIKDIEASEIDKVVVTDSIARNPLIGKGSKIEVVTVAQLIADSLSREI